MGDEAPPRVGLGLLKRAAVAAFLIVFMTAGAVSAAGLLTADDFINQIEQEGRTPIAIPEEEIDRAEAGEAQTLMILGSDERFDDKAMGIRPRSDTIILVRLDPDAGAIAVMSIPRDLKVRIPGHVYEDKINAAYENGGPRLTLKTVKQLLSTPEREFEINHIVNINFEGFRRAIDYIGCVYVDIDRRYFNDRGGPGGYATIDVQPGYQKMCGPDALDYVRYRHGDNDLVRAARQQDFLRQLKAQSGIRRILKWSERREIAKLVGRYTDTDKGLRSKRQVFSLLKLVLFTARKPIREVRFRIDETDDLVYLTATPDKLQRTVKEFLAAKASDKPRKTSEPTEADERTRRERRRRSPNRSSRVPGLEEARKQGEDQAIVGAREVDFPFYFPTLRTSLAAYASPEPRTYRIRDELGRRHDAYRLVIHKGLIGEYYGVQGTSWRDPPILDDPSEVREVGGRKLELHYDGRRLRLVAWRTKRAAYWVSNTLTQSLSERQMLAIAASLRRIGQR